MQASENHCEQRMVSRMEHVSEEGEAMPMRHFFVFLMILVSMPCVAQVSAPMEGSRVQLSAGGGIDYWRGDWGSVARFGPSAWASADIWRGLGINAEAHSMIAGGNDMASEYKYYVGEGGLRYSYRHWRAFLPYAKGEIGFGSLSFPHPVGATYTHDTRTTWAVGGGFEYLIRNNVWARVDYTFEGFPDFMSGITGQHHTLNPAGIAIGVTYHFRTPGFIR